MGVREKARSVTDEIRRPGRPHLIPGTPKGERSRKAVILRILPDTAEEFAEFCAWFAGQIGFPLTKSEIAEKAIKEFMERERAKGDKKR
jgi:hypothetical protein